MFRPLVTVVGKSVRKLARARGGGTALPGLVVERIDPKFVSSTLASLPMGVVLISGTNGKTTTTKMVVELLEANGIKVFTNKTGSNFSRGVAAALLEEMSLMGKIKTDIAVLELDEAHAVNFAKAINPSYCLILNVMRDQLDRFGEIDTTARLLGKVLSHTAKSVVLNREDPLVANLAGKANCQVTYYGLSPQLKKMFPSDKELHDDKIIDNSHTPVSVKLESTDAPGAVFVIDGHKFNAKLKVNGLYNIYNAAAALTLVKQIAKDIATKDLVKALEKIEPAFGRGEIIKYADKSIELVLVKNPSGFKLGIESFSKNDLSTMIVINDNFADSRDVSWLWDVDFTKLKFKNLTISGLRADDMALRLHYDEIKMNKIEPDIKKALNSFLKSEGSNKLIFCTYTAMLAVRKQLVSKPLGER